MLTSLQAGYFLGCDAMLEVTLFKASLDCKAHLLQPVW